MSYDVETKDGIVIRGVPDDIPADHPSVKAKVEAARASRSTVDPNEAADVAAKGTGIGETLAVGAGRTFDKAAMGLKQATLEGVKRLPVGEFFRTAAQKELDALAVQEGEKDTAYAGLQRERPIATAAGEALPYVAIPASAGILPAAAAVGGAEAAKYGSAGERAARGATGALSTAAGGLLAKGVSKFFAPVSAKAAAPANREALAAAERIGVKPRLSEVTGSPITARMEDYAARAPGGSGVMADFAQANQTAVNKAAARSMGENADELTSGVFAAASDRLGKVFEGIKNLPGKPIEIGQNVAAAADDVLRQIGKSLPSHENDALIHIANQAKVLAANKGRIDGETYQLLRSGLSEASYDATGTMKTMYGKLLNALDDAADASLRAGGQEALADAIKTARPEYANMLLLQKGAVAEAGNVSAPRVAAAVRNKNAGAFRRGSFFGPLDDVARVGEGMKPLRAGSPTAERGMVSDPLSIAWHSAFSYPAAKVTTGAIPRAYAENVGVPLARLGATEGGRIAGDYSQSALRALIASQLQSSNLLPLGSQ